MIGKFLVFSRLCDDFKIVNTTSNRYAERMCVYDASKLNAFNLTLGSFDQKVFVRGHQRSAKSSRTIQKIWIIHRGRVVFQRR